MNKNLLFFAKVSAGLAAVGFMAVAASAYAMTPTLSLSSASGNSVEATVSGDANSNVVFYYNVASASGMQTQSLGSTNASGYFSTTISPSNIIAGDNTYVVVDGQQSAMQAWPTPTGVPSLNQTSVTIGLGQSVSVYSEGSSAAVYAASNSNPSAASVSVNGTQITIIGNQTGSTNVSMCYAGTASDCANLYVDVQAGSVLTFSQGNPSVTVGQSVTVSLSGGSGYYVSSNSNSNIVQPSVNGTILTLYGSSAGSASVVVCASGGSCNTLYVTVVATTSTAVSGSTTSASLLAAIQSMQVQLAQLVTQIQSMATTLTQLAASATANTGTTTTTAPAGTYDFTEFLGVGSQNAQATELQDYLTQKGLYTGPITGYFGTLTENAVAAYQTAHGINSVGYVGPSTRAAMNAGE